MNIPDRPYSFPGKEGGGCNGLHARDDGTGRTASAGPADEDQAQWTEPLIELFAGLRKNLKMFSARARPTQSGFRVLSECMYPNQKLVEVDVIVQGDGAYAVSDGRRTFEALQSIDCEIRECDHCLTEALRVSNFKKPRASEGRLLIANVPEKHLAKAVLVLANAAAATSRWLLWTYQFSQKQNGHTIH